MPLLEDVHDFAHPVESDAAWSESYYFNAYDPATDSGFFTRIGVRPNEGTMDVGLSVWLPNNELAHVVAVREQKEMVDVGLEAGGNELAIGAGEDLGLDHQLSEGSESGALEHADRRDGVLHRAAHPRLDRVRLVEIGGKQNRPDDLADRAGAS